MSLKELTVQFLMQQQVVKQDCTKRNTQTRLAPDHMCYGRQAEVQVACCKGSLQFRGIKLTVVITVYALEPLQHTRADGLMLERFSFVRVK